MDPRVRPFRGVGVRNVQSGDSYSLDLVGVLRNKALDGLLIVITQYRRHDGGGEVSGEGGESGRSVGRDIVVRM